MTTVTFLQKSNHLMGFKVKGHSGYGEEGEDIVCAAISSAVRLVEATLSDVLGLDLATEVEEAYVSVQLPSPLEDAQSQTVEVILKGMVTYLTQLEKEYPDFITVCTSS